MKYTIWILLLMFTLAAYGQDQSRLPFLNYDPTLPKTKYQMSATQTMEVMSAQEQFLLSSQQTDVFRERYATALAKVKHENGWGDEVVFTGRGWDKQGQAIQKSSTKQSKN